MIEQLFNLIMAALAFTGVVAEPPEIPQHGTVTEVIDGDTVKVKNSYETYTVRFLGVDTPESSGAVHPEEFRNVSKSCLRTFAGNSEEYVRQEMLDKEVDLEYDTVSGTHGSFDRLLAEVKYSEEKLSINRQLLVKGYARFYPDEEYTEFRRNSLQSIYNESVEKEKGIWGGCQ